MMLFQQTYKTHSNYHLGTDESPFIRKMILRAPSCRLLPSRSTFAKSVTVSVAVSTRAQH